MQLTIDFPALSNERGSRTGICQHCNRAFRVNYKGRPRTYCTANCRLEAYANRHAVHKCFRCERIILNPANKQRQCSTCTHFYAMVRKGRSFARYVARSGSVTATPYQLAYCSTCLRCTGRKGSRCLACNPKQLPPPEQASALVRAWPNIYVRNCGWCDTHFHHTTGYRSKFCCDQCRKESISHSTSQSHGPKKRNPLTHTCSDCTVALPITRSRCDECKQKIKATSRRRRKQRAKALRRGIASDVYTTQQIAERDEFLCGICGDHVHMHLKCPDPGSPSIDHILPISKGGNDTLGNVQLAHFECNWMKGDSTWVSVTHSGGAHRP